MDRQSFAPRPVANAALPVRRVAQKRTAIKSAPNVAKAKPPAAPKRNPNAPPRIPCRLNGVEKKSPPMATRVAPGVTKSPAFPEGGWLASS